MVNSFPVVLTFAVAGGFVFIGFVISFFARLFQYREYAGGKFFSEYFPRSVILEIMYVAMAGIVIFAGHAALAFIGVRSVEAIWIGAGVALLIGGAMLYRGLRIVVQGIAPQARAFGISTMRSSVPTGPLRAAVPMEKLVVANLDTNDFV